MARYTRTIFALPMLFGLCTALYSQSADMYTTLSDRAQELAEQTYRPANSADSLSNLDYNQYRSIHFDHSKRIWESEQLPFQLELLPAGYLYQTAVQVYLVDASGTRALDPESSWFLDDQGQVVDAGAFSGIRVLSEENAPGVMDEVLVFQGASYFRAVPKNAQFGLSARAMVIPPQDGQPEEFPYFRALYVEQPAESAQSLRIWALMDSPSLTGVYEFELTPGKDLQISVTSRVFFRRDLENVGLAPATSMFLFNSSERNRIDDYREGVHDSDTLWLERSEGIPVIRPLINPRHVQYSSPARGEAVRYGLLQRNRDLDAYADWEAHYEARPNLWVEPSDNWPAGSLELLEFPTDIEATDNIGVYWKPSTIMQAGASLDVSYVLHWSLEEPELSSEPLLKVSQTRSGAAVHALGRQFTIDFAYSPQYDFAFDQLDLSAVSPKLISSSGQEIPVYLHVHEQGKALRASFVLPPREQDGDGDPIELMLSLQSGQRQISETWLYRWEGDNE